MEVKPLRLPEGYPIVTGAIRVFLLTPECQNHEKVYNPHTCTMCWHCRLCGASGCDNMAFRLRQEEPATVVYKRWDITKQQWVDVPPEEAEQFRSVPTIRHPSTMILGDSVARDCAEPPIPHVVYSPDFLARKAEV